MGKRILLVAGGGYLLGFLGVFIATLMQNWDLGPGVYIMGEALVRALVWPYEIVRLFT